MKNRFTLILLLIFCWNGLSGEGCNRILSTIQTPTNWEFLRVPTATLTLFATSARHSLTHLGDEFGSVERRAVQQEIDRIEGVIARKSLEKYSFSTIQKETGFIDLLGNLLKKEGITLEDFHYMIQKNVKALTRTEKMTLTNIRNALPKPEANTLMQKSISQRDIVKYISGEYDGLVGFVTRASDAKHLKNFEDIYCGLRLDYSGTTFFIEEGSCGIIRFKSIEIPQKVVIPIGGTFDELSYPFTSTGFTAGYKGRLGVPELKLVEKIDFSEGDEIWEIFNNGTEKLRAVYKGNMFIEIK